MSLKEQLKEDLKSAMRDKDNVRKNVVQLIKAGVLQVEKDNKVTLDDEGVSDVIAKQLKQRRDSLPDYEKSGREDLINQFIKEHSPLIISANFIPEKYKQDYTFCSNVMRYSAMEDKCDLETLLITSNLMDVCSASNILNYPDLCFDDKGKSDNCVIMLMKLLIKLGKNRVYIAGFDGYQEEGCNYIPSYLSNQHTKGMEENIRNTMYVSDIRKKMEVVFLTPSRYDK